MRVCNGAARYPEHQWLCSELSVAQTLISEWDACSVRTAAWFAWFVPADKLQLAFAAVYEGDVASKAHGGSHAAPMIAMILKDVYKDGNKKQLPDTGDTRVRKAEPVEEDEGD